jgi:signal transduction histidine kinase
MDRARIPLPDRLLDTVERLLELPAGELKATLTHVSDVIAAATGADKVDAFLYDAKRDSLVAVGASTQPLSALQRSLGLDVLPMANGGRSAGVFRTGESVLIGRVDEDTVELPGIRDALGVRSLVAVPLDIGGRRRGVLMITSRTAEYFTTEDLRFTSAAGRWAGIVAHRAELVEEIARNAAEAGRRAGAEELVTVVAHDLRNHLAPLAMRLEVMRLRAQDAPGPEAREDVEAMRRSVSRLSGLVDEILDVARIDEGMYHVALQALDLAALVRGTVESFSSARHALHLSVQDGGPIRIAGDAGRLRQCLDNVIANAVQKSPAEGAVSVFVTLARPTTGAPQAVVEVVDEGPGIPAEVLPHVFDRFYTGRGRSGGLGLGLYLAKRIAQLHRGDLTVESSPGLGARFRLTLPALPEDFETSQSKDRRPRESGDPALK